MPFCSGKILTPVAVMVFDYSPFERLYVLLSVFFISFIYKYSSCLRTFFEQTYQRKKKEHTLNNTGKQGEKTKTSLFCTIFLQRTRSSYVISILHLEGFVLPFWLLKASKCLVERTRCKYVL